jgi:hypothetical protein
MTVDPLDIEDTSDWLGCPTELETITHYKLMLENEVQELTGQLRKAREDIFGLAQMYAELCGQRDEAFDTTRIHKQLSGLVISARP